MCAFVLSKVNKKTGAENTQFLLHGAWTLTKVRESILSYMHAVVLPVPVAMGGSTC